jgi:hypothetical protein
MPFSGNPSELIYNRWERFLNSQSEAFGGDREFTHLSNKLDEARSALFADGQVTPAEFEVFVEKMQAVAHLYATLAERKGIPLESSVPSTRESFRVFREAAEIHFQTLAGDEGQYYRGGLLRQLLEAGEPDVVTHRIVLDLLTSASTPIATDKLHLLRAQLALLGDGVRQRALLERARHQLAAEVARPVWTAQGREPAIGPEQFDQACRFESVVSVRSVPLPSELRATNRMLPNRPIAGRDSANRAAVRALLADLRPAGALFLDRIQPSQNPVSIAIKIELNLGIEGPPSVTDPAVTYAVISELLEVGETRGLSLRFTIGDSNGIENAPVGRTSLDVMRDTGNYHAALKAALEFGSRPSMPEETRARALENLGKLLALEQASPAVYFGSSDDRVSSAQDLQSVEAAASPWLVCCDYDQTGFRAIDAKLGPLGRAVWGSDQFHVAEPWVAADYRVHITRGASTHLFAGWTGSLKGLIGLHALGGRPGDHGMKQRGESPLDVLTAVMQSGSFTGLFSARSGVRDFARLASACEDLECRSAGRQSSISWGELSRFAAGRSIWTKGASALEAELRRDQAAGVREIDLMAKMRRSTAALLTEAELAAPGFRAALWQGVADGTRAFLLTMWKMREHLPSVMRDERMGLRIGLLSRLPYQSDLVVQGLPKIGIGGGPDAYFEVRDAGIVVAGTDEISVDLTVLLEAGVPGNPWAFNHPIQGALRLGPGPMCREEIKVIRDTRTP